LDGALRHVPHEHGFPGLDKGSRGLVPVTCVERSGLVFVAQDGGVSTDGSLRALPPLIAPELGVLSTTEREVAANWKILVESFLEGYHIRSTHAQTFYPVQFDNLNVVETFGANSRVTYPYRAINKLRDRPQAEWTVAGKLTYVYHLFPNAIVATFPANLVLVILEPIAIDRTLFVTYVLGSRGASDGPPRASGSGGSQLLDAGGAEDIAISLAIQRGLASGANEYFEFGRFEAAIAHFHRCLDAAIDEAQRAPRAISR
jgi:phenylpropionate dioxygenase-like ring-hydroxylating dioxygenase large terminal subunit